MFSRRLRSYLVLLLSTGLACGDGSGQTGRPTADGTTPSPDARPGAAQEGPTTRRVWMTTGWELNNWWIDVSPDGRRVVYEGAEVRNLETGEVTALAPDLYSEQPLFSPDGRQVAFAACCEPGYSLRIGPSDRADSRVLLNEVQGVDGEDRSTIRGLVPLDWSPDGESILVGFGYEIPARDGRPASVGHILAEVSAVDGSYRALVQSRRGEEGWGLTRPNNPRYSPNGRFLAFGRPLDYESSSFRLSTLRLSDDTEEDLGLDGTLIGWSSDGGGVFYSTPGDDGTDVGFLPIRDGAPSGSPRVVASGLAGRPHWVADDRLFYIVGVEYPGLHSATVDMESGRVLSPPTRVPDENGLGDWSPDGLQVAFESAGDPETRRGSFVVRSVAGNNRRDFPAPEGSNRIDWVRWMPGSDAIVAQIRMRVDPASTTTSRHMMRLDLETGRYTDLGAARLGSGAVEFARDGTTVYIEARSGIVAVDLNEHSGPAGLGQGEGAACASGWPRDLGDCRTVYAPPTGDDPCVSPIGGLDLSPDGDELVAVTPECILRIPAAGGAARTIHREPGLQQAVQWTPDGSHVLFIASAGPDRDVGELKVIPASGGEARTLFSYPNLEDVRIHPDGRRILFYGGEVRGELWVLENLPGFGGGHP